MYSRMGKETRDQDISMAEGRAIKRMRRKLEGEENKLKEALKKEMGSKG